MEPVKALLLKSRIFNAVRALKLLLKFVKAPVRLVLLSRSSVKSVRSFTQAGTSPASKALLLRSRISKSSRLLKFGKAPFRLVLLSRSSVKLVRGVHPGRDRSC